MITSMGLWILSSKGERSVVRGEEAPIEQKADVAEPQKKKAEEKKAPEGATQQDEKTKKQGERDVQDDRRL